MESKKRRKLPEDRRGIISGRKKEQMLAVIFQNPEAYTTARECLKVTDFDIYDAHFGVAWEVICKYYDDYQHLPDADMIRTEVEAIITDDPGRLDDTEVEALEKFITWAYESGFDDIATNDKLMVWAVDVLRQYLDDRLAEKTREALYTQSTVPVNMPKVVEDVLQRSTQIQAMTVGETEVPFPEDWIKSVKIDIWGTGVPFLDDFMGGQAAGEVYGLLAPFGSCKTTLGVMLAVEAAKKFEAEAKIKKLPPEKQRVAFVVSYEADLQELRNRAMSYAACISRNTLTEVSSIAELSRSGNLKSYEHESARKLNIPLDEYPGEFERASESRVTLNNHICFIDMTGGDKKHRNSGSGYVPEIANRINRELRSRKNAKCGLVVLDYVGAMCKRHPEVNEQNLRHYITKTPLAVKAEIASRHSCPVWLIAQLSGDANSRSETALLHHTDAAESRSIAENLDFAMVIGRPSLEQLCTIACTKHRRRPPRERVVIKIEGEFNRVMPTGGMYTIDTNSHKIVPVDFKERVNEQNDRAKVPTGKAARSPIGTASAINDLSGDEENAKTEAPE